MKQISGVKLRKSGGVGSDMTFSLNGFSGKHVKSCASLFVKHFENYRQDHSILFSVVGFGSKSFTNSYCQFAVDVDEMLSQEKHFCRLLDLYKINKRSAEEFAA